MKSLRRFFFIWLAMAFAAGRIFAASKVEDQAYAGAVKAFEDGLWESAEIQFAGFAAKYPASERVSDAILGQAQARFKQRKFSEVIVLLAARQAEAGKRADEFLFWRAEAQFQSTRYAEAAEAFGKLAENFPGSARRLEASIREAEARAKLGEWARVTELLQKADGGFQQTVAKNSENALAARGFLLWAEAALAQKKYAEAEAALQRINESKLEPEQAWRKQYLLCRSQLADGRAPDALRNSTALLALAETAARRDLLAESVAFRAGILEQLGQLDNAIGAYERNLVTNAPVERQREALTKIAELALVQNQVAKAMQTLEKFLHEFPNAPAADMALLALGELYLKQHVFSGDTNLNGTTSLPAVATNHWEQALAGFDRLINLFPNSPLAAKAQLDRGWCLWISNRIPESAEAFKIAATRLPPSEDLAVAHFKWGDALFAQKDFTGALREYRDALETASNWPRVKEILSAQSLYQTLRANLELNDAGGAAEAMRKILESHPENMVADRGVLLVAQGLADAGKAEEARALFEEFLTKYPGSTLRPEAELALARASERKADWSAAIDQYDAWLERFATNRLRPQAEFYRAMADFHRGRETNALGALTDFAARFKTNDLAPLAQWWVADHYYSQGDYAEAEINYKLLFLNWPASDLAYPARLMAGRAAVGRAFYTGAIEHFTKLTSDTNCPASLRIQATFAYGGAQMMSLDPGETNRVNRIGNLKLAIQVFGTIPQLSPGSEEAARAWGEIGKCYFQLGSQDAGYYREATNAYWQTINSATAGSAERSQAQIGIGDTLEKLGALKTGKEQQILFLKQARTNYLQVFYETNLREGETRDLFWVKEAGLKAMNVTDTLGEWAAEEKLRERLQELLPMLRATLEKRKKAAASSESSDRIN